MPIPIIIWAAAGIAGGIAAWKNREALGKFIEKAAKEMGEATAEQMKTAKPYVDELMEMDIEEGYHYLDKNIRYMSPELTMGFLLNLKLIAQKSSKAQKFYDRGNKLASEKP